MRSPSPVEMREALVLYAHKFIGQPYEWGGDGRKGKGFDCSGLVQECLAAVGVKFPSDLTAQDIYEHLKIKDDQTFKQEHGNLIFFGKSIKNITHIGITINAFQYIEAGGGDSKNIAGMVRIRPLFHRSDVVAVVDFIKE
jgi:cell wall-associated NlpC family hydrolase